MNFGASAFRSSDAYKLLASELAAFRELGYEELVQVIGPPPSRRIAAANSIEYAIEVEVRWRDQERGDILVIGWAAVDDCGPMHRVDEQFVVSKPVGNGPQKSQDLD